MDAATTFGLVAVGLLILANGYFVAAEFAFVAVKRSRLEASAAEGDRRAGRAVAVLSRLSFMLSGAQLGITVTSLLVGFIAEPSLGEAITPLLVALGVGAEAAPGVALSIGFVLATATQMIVGELAPKNLAIAKPEPLSRGLAGSTLLFLRLAGPVIRLFDSSANRLLRALGIEPVEELEGGIHPDELEIIVAESHGRGHLDEEHADALMRAIEFGDLDAGAVAVPLREVVSLPPEASLVELARLIRQTGHSRFPVLDGISGVAVGIVGTRDLLAVPRDRWASTTAAAQAHAVPAVPDTSSLVGVLEVLRAAHSQSAVVIDEHGTLTGLITFEDLMEELVGEIRDEHDPLEQEVVRPAGPDRWWLAGRARLDEVARETDIELPEGDYDTVAGLVVAELGRLAVEGDVVTVTPTAGLDREGAVARLEVLATDGYVVQAVTLTTSPDEEGTAVTATLWALLLAVGLLALNGFFVAAEFALLAARRSRIEQLAAEGNRAARSALAGIRELSLMLAGAQLGITMCSLGLGIVAEPALAGLIESWIVGVDIPDGVRHAIGFTIALTIVVFLHMVVGEMAPKSWAIAHPEQSALILARPFRAFARVFRWAIVALNAMSNLLVRAVGATPQDELAMVHSPADLALLLKESADHGLMEAEEQQLLVRILALRDIHAEQAMTPRRDIVAVDADASCEELEELARRSGRSRLLVSNHDGELVGAVHVKDVLVLDDTARATATAADLYRPVPAVVAGRDVESVMADLRTSGSHVALVIDEYGSCIGMLTLEDILEELIGDFADESDVDPGIRQAADGSVIVPAGWRVDELADRVGVELPAGDYQTVAGYLLHRLGRIPTVGDRVTAPQTATLTVHQMDATRITQVAITRPRTADMAPTDEG